MAWYARAFRAAPKRIVWSGGEFECLEIDGIQIEFHPADEKVAAGAAGSVVYWTTADFDATLTHLQSLAQRCIAAPAASRTMSRCVRCLTRGAIAMACVDDWRRHHGDCDPLPIA